MSVPRVIEITSSLVYLPGETSIIPIPISDIVGFVIHTSASAPINTNRARLVLRTGSSAWSGIIPALEAICLKAHLRNVCGFLGYESEYDLKYTREYYGFRRGKYRIDDEWVMYDTGEDWIRVFCVHPADRSVMLALIPELEEK